MSHVIPYCPRPLQWQFHSRRTRFCVLLCHRRFGKTVAAINDLLRAALRSGRNDWRAAYAAPFLGQAKAVAWDYLRRFAGAAQLTLLESKSTTLGAPSLAIKFTSIEVPSLNERVPAAVWLLISGQSYKIIRLMFTG